MTTCEHSQAQLAEQGTVVLAHDEVLNDHVENCVACQDFLKHLQQLEQACGDLPAYDAPAELINQTKAKIIQSGQQPHLTASYNHTERRWAVALGGIAAVLAIIALLPAIMPYGMRFDLPELSVNDAIQVVQQKTNSRSEASFADQIAASASAPAPIEENFAESDDFVIGGLIAQNAPLVTEAEEAPVPLADSRIAPLDNLNLAKDETIALAEPSITTELAQQAQSLDSNEEARQQPRRARELQREVQELRAEASQRQEVAAKEHAGRDLGHRAQLDADGQVAFANQLNSQDKKSDQSSSRATESLLRENKNRQLAKQEASRLRADMSIPAAEPQVIQPSAVQPSAVQPSAVQPSAVQSSAVQSPAVQPPPATHSPAPLPASPPVSSADQETDSYRAKAKPSGAKTVETSLLGKASLVEPMKSSGFLQQRENLTGLQFQDATGYWANTYIPGDPIMRQLETQLKQWNRTPLRTVSNIDPALEQSMTQYRQPFDPPQNTALALYLQADKAALAEPGRLRVQVGLKGALRQGGRRPAMNIGVVADLRSANSHKLLPQIRALLLALMNAKQADDRFSLIIAGPGAGVVLTAEAFRYGPLTVALQALLTRPNPSSTSLIQALRLASDSVRQDDDTTAPLGTSLVLLLATSSLGAEQQQLENIAHANAISGINLSAITLGTQTQLPELQTLVLAGQGHLRNLATADQAEHIIDQELYASSRAVARALRLRIRLAPSVKLINVIGSRRLAEPQAQRVREQEQSIDQRLARNLGIQADRGDDEEGIQIIIPHFYAADEHVILLDVVTEQAGSIADVSVRYKDLVNLRNGSNSAQLTLPSGSKPPGPLELNVLKNHVALTLAQAAQNASQLLAAGNYQQTMNILVTMQQILQSIRREIPIWQNDLELINDEKLLASYALLIRSGYVNYSQRMRKNLIASLRVAAHRKLFNSDAVNNEANP